MAQLVADWAQVVVDLVVDLAQVVAELAQVVADLAVDLGRETLFPLEGLKFYTSDLAKKHDPFLFNHSLNSSRSSSRPL